MPQVMVDGKNIPKYGQKILIKFNFLNSTQNEAQWIINNK